MDYINDSFAYPQQRQQQAQMFFQPMQNPQQTYMIHPQYMMNYSQPMNPFYSPYGPADHADFAHPGMMYDEFGDMEETSTRPRLTKDQVEALEAHFKANNKPSSGTKKELASTYGLALARVSNWFQNRRAKAKQQKKQEEFAAQTSMTADDKDAAPGKADTASESGSPCRSVPSPTRGSYSTAPTPPSPAKQSDEKMERAYASVQRLKSSAPVDNPGMSQGRSGRSITAIQSPPQIATTPHHHSDFDAFVEDQNPGMSLPESSSTVSSFWGEQEHDGLQSSNIIFQDNGFDFGFDVADGLVSSDPSMPPKNNAYTLPENGIMGQEEAWAEALTTPKGVTQQQMSAPQASVSPAPEMASYTGSRRQSTTEELSNTFGTVAIASSSPSIMPQRTTPEMICPPSSGPLDIAARRKRPRPAALTSAALTPSSMRSRSYGTLSAVSPTFRPNATTPTMPHTIRHVKSAGHTLNARYAGVRKVSSAQRSPINFSFSENEAFTKALADQAVALNAQSLADVGAPLLTPDLAATTLNQDPEKNAFFGQNMAMAAQMQMHSGQTLQIQATSPPITPMIPDYMSRGLSQQSMMPPASAPPQYASFPDYTPPYSAGPMTNSSWGDGPMMSPDISGFPSVSYMPALGYPQENIRTTFQSFVLPSDNQTEVILDDQDDKKTEFYIQEFPNQKQEHALIAASQASSAQKPRNFVFANTAPQDYTGA